MKILRFSPLALLAVLALVLAGCSKEQTPPSPTPTPKPPPHTIAGKGNPDCKAGGQGGQDCEVDTQQIANETGPAHHCAAFDESTAIIIANQQSVNPGNGRWKGIHLKGTTPTQTFDVTITGCTPGLPPNPFANMPNPGMHEWASGAVAAGVPYGARYEMTVTIDTGKAKAKGGAMKPKGFDPHIVFGG